LLIIIVILIAIYAVIMTTLNKNTVSAFSEDETSVKDVILKQYRKEYSKTNEKRLKKGKEPLTQLDIVKKFRLETKIICNPLLFILSLGFFIFSLWLLMNYKPVLIPIIATIISLIVLFIHISVLMLKKDMYKTIALLEKQELKL
jgi:hypothetical protein